MHSLQLLEPFVLLLSLPTLGHSHLLFGHHSLLSSILLLFLLECVISCISQEQNLILGFETSFCLFATWLLPGLRKMLNSTVSPTGGVTVMARPAIFWTIL